MGYKVSVERHSLIEKKKKRKGERGVESPIDVVILLEENGMTRVELVLNSCGQTQVCGTWDGVPPEERGTGL